MSRDLLDDRYGRFRELPLTLAAGGHTVSGLCLSYRSRDEGHRDDVRDHARVAWQALNLRRLLSLGKYGYWRQVEELARTDPPDVVWACSDAPHAVLGVRVARRLGAALVIDLYDNFESYGLTRLPGMRSALRWAIRAADGLTCVSRPLAGLVRERYGYSGSIEVIENAVPADLFRPHDSVVCRRELNLPERGVLIGTAGALARSRGIDVLFHAFERLAAERSDVHLVLAGPCDHRLVLPRGERVHYLGMLQSDRVPRLLSALDISVICNRESAFGSYCFPQKFYESVACGVPVVVAATGAMRDLLQNWPQFLFQPDNVSSLCDALRGHIKTPKKLPLDAPSWNDLGNKLDKFMLDVRARSSRSVD